MGDRAVIQLVYNNEVSPTLYLHWSGSRVPELLDGLHAQMVTRLTDANYSFARLVGRACNMNGGDTERLSVGVFPPEDELKSPGDAGAFIVNLTTSHVTYYGGYEPDVSALTPWIWAKLLDPSAQPEAPPLTGAAWSTTA